MAKIEDMTNVDAVKSDEVIESEMQFAASDKTFAVYESQVNVYLKQDESSDFYKGFFVGMMLARSMVMDISGNPFVWEGAFFGLMGAAARKHLTMRGANEPANH